MTFVKFLDSISKDEETRFGGKAANLARLHRMGHDIPKGFAISCGCCDDLLSNVPEIPDLLEQIKNDNDPDNILKATTEIECLSERYQLPVHIRNMVTTAFRELENQSQRYQNYVVRSSANIEDGKSISFAGQAKTKLCVEDISTILESIKEIWLSMYSTQSVLYMLSMGLSPEKARMGIVVQEMVNPEISGVMFTADIVNSDTSKVLIESTWGLGEPLVSGKISPDSFVLDKSPISTVRHRIGTKKTMLIVDHSRPVLVETPPEKQNSLSLVEEQLYGLVRKGIEIERGLGRPQDIEWCIDDGNIIILQARPITTL